MPSKNNKTEYEKMRQSYSETSRALATRNSGLVRLYEAIYRTLSNYATGLHLPIPKRCPAVPTIITAGIAWDEKAIVRLKMLRYGG